MYKKDGDQWVVKNNIVAVIAVFVVVARWG